MRDNGVNEINGALLIKRLKEIEAEVKNNVQQPTKLNWVDVLIKAIRRIVCI